MSKTKKQTQKIHAKIRCWERLGIYISNDVIERIVKDIQTQKAIFLERQSNRITKWKVDIENIPCIAIYDSNRKTIVTIWRYNEI